MRELSFWLPIIELTWSFLKSKHSINKRNAKKNVAVTTPLSAISKDKGAKASKTHTTANPFDRQKRRSSVGVGVNITFIPHSPSLSCQRRKQRDTEIKNCTKKKEERID